MSSDKNIQLKMVEIATYILLFSLCIVNLYLLLNPFYVFVKVPFTRFLFERVLLFIMNIFALLIILHGERYEDRKAVWLISFAMMGAYLFLLVIGWMDMYNIHNSFIPLGLLGETIRFWLFGLFGCMLLALMRIFEFDLKRPEEK